MLVTNTKIKMKGKNLKKIKEKCLDVLYPPRCPACGGILEDKQRSICPQCESIFHPVSEYYCMKCGKPVNETEEYCSECRHRERKFIRGRSVFLYNAQMKNSLLLGMEFHQMLPVFANPACTDGYEGFFTWIP